MLTPSRRSRAASGCFEIVEKESACLSRYVLFWVVCGDESPPNPMPTTPDVAAVALFYHVIGADGVVDEVEAEKLKSMIMPRNMVTVVQICRNCSRRVRRPIANRWISTPSPACSTAASSPKEGAFHRAVVAARLCGRHRHELEDHVVWRICRPDGCVEPGGCSHGSGRFRRGHR
jgi:hypothetical protein